MISIAAMVILTLVLIAYPTFSARIIQLDNARAESSRRLLMLKLGFTVLYVSLLIIAIRFGTRTFPGIFVPNCLFLNYIMQGGMFGLAYAATLACGVIDMVSLFVPALNRGPVHRILVWSKRIFLVGIIVVCLLGLLTAVLLARLP